LTLQHSFNRGDVHQAGAAVQNRQQLFRRIAAAQLGHAFSARAIAGLAAMPASEAPFSFSALKSSPREHSCLGGGYPPFQSVEKARINLSCFCSPGIACSVGDKGTGRSWIGTAQKDSDRQCAVTSGGLAPSCTRALAQLVVLSGPSRYIHADKLRQPALDFRSAGKLDGLESERSTPSFRQKLLAMVTTQFEFSRGSPLPFGATLLRGGINFSVFSKHATAVSLVLFFPGESEPLIEFPFDPHFNRTGDVWHAFLLGLDPGIHYAFRMDRPHNENPLVHRFDRQNVLLDPYSRAIAGHSQWGKNRDTSRRAAIIESHFDWELDQPLNTPLADSVIYELHVRGFTQHRSSAVSKPGTFAGLIEKVPYLQSLGVTAIELLPIFEFDETPNRPAGAEAEAARVDYWGYNPISFFAPKAAYSSAVTDVGPVNEFKSLVKSLHAAGIEVILDAVFNHTAEGNERGPTFSFRGIDNAIYYMIDQPTGQYLNYSGCGNTLNCNHPVVRDLVSDVLRYWVTEMHVDGFRFDLASVLGRGQDGSVLASPPLLEHLTHDPVLARTKLIAEAWDAAGLYQVGTFPAWRRWAEWNGKFRDDIRKFVKGDPGMVSVLATRLMGSADLYSANLREPWHSINFITCHDGFTLADLVSYNHKHNGANGEQNRDGSDDNSSWNCGAEGASSLHNVNRLRFRQVRNLATLLMLSQGVPMLLAGDEFGRSQRGNNNAYCQDNEISWLDWNLLETNADLLRFFSIADWFPAGPRGPAPLVLFSAAWQ
jgi:isoamylase